MYRGRDEKDQLRWGELIPACLVRRRIGMKRGDELVRAVRASGAERIQNSENKMNNTVGLVYIHISKGLVNIRIN